MEPRELLTTGLGAIPGVTDSPAALMAPALYEDLQHRVLHSCRAHHPQRSELQQEYRLAVFKRGKAISQRNPICF
jgi:hypothetical protein